MSFINPILLAGLPLVTLPILIHLWNRRRYQTVNWGAMRFLLQATQQARKQQRLRYLLIMAARMAAIAGLILVISRPLAGGWMSWFSGQPDTVLVILDRSTSMSQQDLQTTNSKRSAALGQIAGALQTLGKPPHLVLLDSGSGTARQLDEIAALLDLPETKPTDTTADLPRLLQTALNYVVDNQAGRTDIWVCSDLQREDWNAESGQWAILRSGFSELPQDVRFHLLTYPDPPEDNLAVHVTNVRRQQSSNEEAELVLDIHVERHGRQQGEVQVPLEVVIDGARSVVNLQLQGAELVLNQHRIALGKEQKTGWGKVELPADANPRDNVFFFAYGEPASSRVVVVSEQPRAARPLVLAAAPPVVAGRTETQVVTPEELGTVPWDQTSLVLWQAPLPVSSAAAQLTGFVDAGGVVVFFPPETLTGAAAAEQTLYGAQWGAWSEDSEAPKQIESYRDESELLGKTQSGRALPLGQLKVRRHRELREGGQVLARLQGGQPLLTRAVTDRGGVYFCTTLPDERNSNMARQGIVLLALIQRCLELGNARLDRAVISTIGEPLQAGSQSWERVAGWEESLLSTEQPLVAGVYRIGDRLLARNRPLTEDHLEPLAAAELGDLFAGLNYDLVTQNVQGTTALVNEIWRICAVALVLALLLEAWLCLPDAVSNQGPTTA